MLRYLFFTLTFTTFISSYSFAQVLQWAKKMGGNSDENSRKSIIDSHGNIYIGGSLKGNNVDFDPSAGTYNLNSAGQKDFFLAKYNKDGLLKWAFRVGGSSEEDLFYIALDNAGDLVITGYFRGQNVDFDPGAGISMLNSNGESGWDPGYGGDIYVAKYDTLGNYKWAFNIGGSVLGESSVGIAIDDFNNILITGYSHTSADFDPSSGSYFLNGSQSPIYVAKYTPNAQLLWAFNTGTGGVDNSGYSITCDNSNNVIVTGYFQGTNVDFNPSPSVSNTLSSNGSFDLFIAKYSPQGEYMWAINAGGTGVDIGWDVITDNNNNIYVTGEFLSNSMDIDPGPGVNQLINSGSNEGFVTKFSPTGQHIWGFKIGSTGLDVAWGITKDLSENIIVTGTFSGAVDFDPSASTNSLSSSGNMDIFVAKYSNTGQHLCTFNIGGTGNDRGFSVNTIDNYVYVAGTFNSSNADFDPGTGTFNLSSLNDDVYIAKYNWSTINPEGLISGDVYCSTIQQPQLTFTATSGTAPFTLVISDGITNVTYNNIDSGIPFNILNFPGQTTQYSLVSIKDANLCSAPVPGNSTTSITINPSITATVSGNVTICQKDSVQLVASGGNSYQWIPAAGLNNANIADPKASPTATTTYKVIVSSTAGCKDSAYVTVTVNPLPVINLSPNTSICPSDSAQLSASGGITYQWFPATGLSNSGIANPKASPITTTTYKAIVTTAEGCRDSASTTVSVLTKPVATASNDITVCSGDTVLLSASGGTNYQWFPTTGISHPNQPNTNAYPNATTEYSAIVTNADGCKDTAKTIVTVTAKPDLDLGPDNEICNGDIVSFDATIQGASSYLWNNGSTDAAITVSQTGSYSVQVGITGCISPIKDTVNLSVLSLPTVNLGPDTSTCNFEPLILKAQGTDISTYLWSTGGTDSFIVVNSAGPYQVMVSNACGTASDEAIIAIEICSDDIYFPSAFTPNYDGRNDLFKAAYMNGVSITGYSLKVFNRWGQLVFKTDDHTKGWDGIFKGKMQQTDVFVWLAEYKKSTSGELIRKKGTVTLLR